MGTGPGVGRVGLTAVGCGGGGASCFLEPTPISSSIPALPTSQPVCNNEIPESNGSVLTDCKQFLRYEVLFLSGGASTLEQSTRGI